MKSMLKLGFAMAAYSVVACVLLAVVYGATNPIIEEGKQREVNESLAQIYTGVDSFEAASDFTVTTLNKVVIDSLYVAKKDGQVVGCVVQATGPTYDPATLLIGVTKDHNIPDVKFMAISDTPGFGQKAPGFYAGKFQGKSTDDAFVAKQDVEAISGATITSNGVAGILKNAADVAGKYLAK
jgi:electron transport complex protein RnfG